MLAVSCSVFDQIIFARIRSTGAQQDEAVVGDFKISGAHADAESPERFNFVAGADGSCYGYVMPMGKHGKDPHPHNNTGWLVLFVSRENVLGTSLLRPMGWYEEACFARSYQHRPEPALQHYEYIVTARAENAYLIPAERRYSFPTISNDRFQRHWTYARSPFHTGIWRQRLAELAEQIVSRKCECTRLG